MTARHPRLRMAQGVEDGRQRNDRHNRPPGGRKAYLACGCGFRGNGPCGSLLLCDDGSGLRSDSPARCSRPRPALRESVDHSSSRRVENETIHLPRSRSHKACYYVLRSYPPAVQRQHPNRGQLRGSRRDRDHHGCLTQQFPLRRRVANPRQIIGSGNSFGIRQDLSHSSSRRVAHCGDEPDWGDFWSWLREIFRPPADLPKAQIHRRSRIKIPDTPFDSAWRLAA